MRFNKTSFVLVLVTLAVTVACGGPVSPTALPITSLPGKSAGDALSTPTPNSLGTPWSQLPPLSPDVKTFVVEMLAGSKVLNGELTGWDPKNPVRIYSPEFTPAEVGGAVAYWVVYGFSFEMAANALDANLTIDTTLSAGVACGHVVPRITNGVVVGGAIHLSRSLKCNTSSKGDFTHLIVLGLAHEIGHLLVAPSPTGHTPGTDDILSGFGQGPVYEHGPFLSEYVRWLTPLIGKRIRPIEG